LASALALSAIAVPLTTTQQVSTASPNCKLPDDRFFNTSYISMPMSQMHTFADTSKVEIISGANIVSLTGNSHKPLKRGTAVVHEHYKNGMYISYEVVVY